VSADRNADNPHRRFAWPGDVRTFGKILGGFAVLLLWCAVSADAADGRIKSGLEPADIVYTLAEGVTVREVTYYSDDVACYAKLFFPKGFTSTGGAPGVVLAHGWAGTHESIEKYGARFAEKGLVAMVIDYRSWGKSNGFTTLANKSLQARSRNSDAQRYTRGEFQIETKRTRLVPMKQVEDIRNAISYLQGEPGVDGDRIGVWGSSFAGGNVIVAAAMDARVKAIATQAPSIAGKGTRAEPFHLQGRMLDDAIRRACIGQGAQIETDYIERRMIDYETKQLVAEFRPFHQLQHIGDRPVLFILSENEELLDNKEHGLAAADVLTGPKKVIQIPNTTHFDLYVGQAFEISANAAADWFKQYLGAPARPAG
jgi:dienelactone hydrolase